MTGRDDVLVGIPEVAEMVRAAVAVEATLDEVGDTPSDLVNDVSDCLIVDDPGEYEDGTGEGVPNAVADVSTGISLGRRAGEIGGHVFTATWTDLDDRAFHWFFVAKDREEVVSRVRKALAGFLPGA